MEYVEAMCESEPTVTDEMASQLIAQLGLPELGVQKVLVNGEPGLLITSAGIPDNVVAADLGADGRIAAIRLIRNPDKLQHIRRR